MLKQLAMDTIKCVADCNADDKITTFPVPKADTKFFHLWNEVISYALGKTLEKTHRVCEKHFKKEDLKDENVIRDSEGKVVFREKLLIKTLKKGAIPCIFGSKVIHTVVKPVFDTVRPLKRKNVNAKSSTRKNSVKKTKSVSAAGPSCDPLIDPLPDDPLHQDLQSLQNLPDPVPHDVQISQQLSDSMHHDVHGENLNYYNGDEMDCIPVQGISTDDVIIGDIKIENSSVLSSMVMNENDELFDSLCYNQENESLTDGQIDSNNFMSVHNSYISHESQNGDLDFITPDCIDDISDKIVDNIQIENISSVTNESKKLLESMWCNGSSQSIKFKHKANILGNIDKKSNKSHKKAIYKNNSSVYTNVVGQDPLLSVTKNIVDQNNLNVQDSLYNINQKSINLNSPDLEDPLSSNNLLSVNEDSIDQKNVNLQIGSSPEEKSSLFYNLFRGHVKLRLPNRRWSKSIQNLPDLILLREAGKLIVPNQIPWFTKQITINPDMKIELFLLHRHFTTETNLNTLEDVQSVIHRLAKMVICSGGPSVALYPDVAIKCAYQDITGHWRHNSCKIISSPQSICKRCSDLGLIFREHLTSQSHTNTDTNTENNVHVIDLC